jgi:hypothetical protein
MIDLTPDRFAKASFDELAHQGTFTVAVPDDEKSAAVAHAFEVLGCTVEAQPFEMQLRVTAPPRAA